MNCKKGDLAIVIKSKTGNEGKIVTCLKWGGQKDGFIRNFSDLWLIDREVTWRNSQTGEVTKLPYYPDQWLRPLPQQRLEEEKETKKRALY